MKRIKYILAITLVGILSLASCQSDWLDTTPTDSADSESLLSTTDNAKQALNGICKLMSMQHAYYGQGFNGEGTIMSMYGEFMGQDCENIMFAPGWSTMYNGKINVSNTRIYDAYPWYYYYLIIGNANSLLSSIDNASGDANSRDFIKAEALTFRAHAYSMLVQFYSNSWKTSNNGTSAGVPLRLDTSKDSLALSTLGQCYDQIFADSKQAISLYKSSGLSRNSVYSSSAVCFPNINVAYGIYARAALNKEDYKDAVLYADSARTGYALMSNDDYKSGFCAPSSEWIWGTYNDSSENLYYWSYQVTMAYNGYYAAQAGYDIVANKTLIDALPSGDVRKNLFINSDVFLYGTKSYSDLIENQYGSFTDDEAYNKANDYATKNCKYTPGTINFPYQNLKFACTDLPGVGDVPLMRSSEMLLIEAEANYYLSRPQAAQQNLIELNTSTNRTPSYTCTKTGDDLLQEIRLYRRAELWGEGHSWFDCKRWGINVYRPGFNNGGNFHAAIAGTYGSDASFWKWIIPAKETDYNSAIKN